ncbi:MAG: M48 family metallopeptidase [Victivallaceae bacterium]|nr:M48 family metallopeptidase [Victivallaceae bacterium]
MFNFRKVQLMMFGLVITVVIFIAGCATVPITGRTQFLATSESTEIEQGEQAWRELCAKTPISNNRKLNAALQRVGKNIAAVSGRKDYKWEFKVFDTKEPNAFCLPGGKVGATTGLFNYTANDAELATVVGHEVGHAIARHSGERMSQGIAAQIGGEVLNTSTGSDWSQAYGTLAQFGFMLPYSRVQEYESDHIGMILMARAGYDPQAAMHFWAKFGKLSQTNEWTEFLATHPMGEKRLKELENLYPQAQKEYQKAPVKHGYGESLK